MLEHGAFYMLVCLSVIFSEKEVCIVYSKQETLRQMTKQKMFTLICSNSKNFLLL